MMMTRLRRSLALVTAAAVLASLTVATVASPASAAKPRCQGLTATIVGTGKSEVIRGTARRDIIVAKGGNDRIYGRGGNDVICAGGGNDVVFGGPGADRLWGQLGHDYLNGNAGPDFLAGQVGNDSLVGGIGVDTCFQGTGSGEVWRCERPAPPPSGPKLLAVAYADLDGSHSFTGGDVMISQLVDGDGDGRPSTGDIVEMGQYPTSLRPGTGDFAGWRATRHTVLSVARADGQGIIVSTEAGGRHTWSRRVDPHLDAYEEYRADASSLYSGFFDNPDTPSKLVTVSDEIAAHVDSPSLPSVGIAFSQSTGTGDDRFIDVEIYP